MARKDTMVGEVTRSGRGGVSLSRARRLSDQIHGSRKGSRAWLAIFPIGALIAGGVWYQTTIGDQPTVRTTAPTETAADPASAQPGETSAAAAQVATNDAGEAPTTCEGIVGWRLERMSAHAGASETDLTWGEYRGAITSLVQQVLNCPAASFEVVGSLELIDQNLADLQVSWNTATHQMTLTTVSEGADPAPAPDADSIQFMLR